MKRKSLIMAIGAVMILVAVLFTACGGDDGDDSGSDCSHVFDNGTVTTAATCIAKGVLTKTCTKCTETTTEEIAIAPNAHDWEQDGKAVIEPTCLEEGEGAFHCARNGCNVTDDHHAIDALGHIAECFAETCRTDCKIYEIGEEGPGGGIIYYVADGQSDRSLGFTMQMVDPDDNYTAYYLEAAPANATGGASPYTSATMRWSTATGSPFATITDLENIPTTNIGTGTSYSVTQINALRAEIGKGRRNTTLIVASDTGAYDHAAKACSKYTTSTTTAGDWFLPSIGELYFLYEQRNLTGIGMTDRFWSSSQGNSSYAWSVRFDNGERIDTSDKNNIFRVRAIRAF